MITDIPFKSHSITPILMTQEFRLQSDLYPTASSLFDVNSNYHCSKQLRFSKSIPFFSHFHASFCQVSNLGSSSTTFFSYSSGQLSTSLNCSIFNYFISHHYHPALSHKKNFFIVLQAAT